MMRIYVMDRVHQRHPEISEEDVITAFRSVEVDARRNRNTWVCIGLDGKGRDLEIVYKQLDDMVLIYHALTPPTRKTIMEIQQRRHQ